MTLHVQTHTLACGMTLLLAENHEVGVATADVWAHTGGADEPDDVAGISHFLEHMLFKGTSRWGLGEIERAIEAVGGVCNAGTSFDFTHYYVTLPSFAIGLGVEMLAAMVRDSTLDAGELEKERQVILEEYRRKQDSPGSLLYERLYTETFQAGRYHRPVIGTEETIRAIDRPRMMDYYQKRYAKESLTLVVTGHFDPHEIIQGAEAAFAGFVRPLAIFESPRAGRYAPGHRAHVEKQTGGEVYAVFAVPAPGYDQSPRVVPIDLLQCLLGHGRGATLYQKIKEERGLCSSIGVSYPTHESDSLLAVTATCKPEQLDPLRDAIMEELALIAKTPPPPDEFERARRLLSSAHRFSLETTGSLSSQIGYAHTVGGSLEHFLGYLDRLERVTPEDVRQSAEECFGGGQLASSLIEVTVGPSGAKGKSA